MNTDTSRKGEVRLRGVEKAFGAAHALSGIDMTVRAGSFTVLLGPSGCGKSTLLRIIAGLEAATAGQVAIGGRDVSALPPAARGISMVFQSYALFPHLSVGENVIFGLRARRVPRAERDARLKRAADMLGLAPLLDRRPSQLSGGQQQRVALARAVVAEAPVCLMDEPLSNLDAKLRTEMRREIRALQKRLDMTMIYVTHDQAEAMSMADQVVLMKDGRIEQDATPPEVYARPASVFAAGFIGTPPMSLLRLGPGGAAMGTDGPVLGPGGAILGVRPEDVVLVEGVGTDGPGLPARVIAAEFLGAETVIACAIGAAGEQMQVRIPGHHLFEAGALLRLSLPPATHLFDAASGRRLPDAAPAGAAVPA